MKYLLLLLLIPIIIMPAYGQYSAITLTTDKTQYYWGETAHITGTVPEIQPNEYLKIFIHNPAGTFVKSIYTTPTDEKTFQYSYEIPTDPLALEGRYTVTASYTGNTQKQVFFEFSQPPVCVGDQTVVNGICVDPVCIGDQILVEGVCIQPTCIGDQTIVDGVCIDPVCAPGQILQDGYCVEPYCPTPPVNHVTFDKKTFKSEIVRLDNLAEKYDGWAVRYETRGFPDEAALWTYMANALRNVNFNIGNLLD